jgi:hypothetical protein
MNHDANFILGKYHLLRLCIKVVTFQDPTVLHKDEMLLQIVTTDEWGWWVECWDLGSRPNPVATAFPEWPLEISWWDSNLTVNRSTNPSHT